MLPAAIIAAAALAFVSPTQLQARSTPPIAITHVTVVDVATGELQPDRTVLIRDSHIASVNAASGFAVPEGATVVDGRGKFLIPGLWDMHVHVAGSPENNFPLFVANGITGVRNLHTTMPFPLETVASLRADVASGAIIGPRFVANGPLIDGPTRSWPGAVVAATADDGRSAVDSLQANGAEFIKVYTGLDRATYFAIAQESKRKRIPFVGHVPLSLSAAEASDAGQRSLEHVLEGGLVFGCSSRDSAIRAHITGLLDGTARDSGELGPDGFVKLFVDAADSYDDARCRALSARFVRNGTWIDPTLVAEQAAWNAADITLPDSILAYMSDRVVRGWKARLASARTRPDTAMARRFFEREMAIVGTLAREGVGILAGSDVGNDLLVSGFSLHDELSLLVRAGLTPLAALQAATLNPARFLGAIDSLGTVSAGKLADLVLLDADPLRDITNARRVAGVVLNGRYLDRGALDALVAPVRSKQ